MEDLEEFARFAVRLRSDELEELRVLLTWLAAQPESEEHLCLAALDAFIGDLRARPRDGPRP